MLVRLAYSIAIQIPFDVLLLDEVLAVGDEAFQEKCFATFDRFKEEGKTVVFVSHALELDGALLRPGACSCRGEACRRSGRRARSSTSTESGFWVSSRTPCSGGMGRPRPSARSRYAALQTAPAAGIHRSMGTQLLERGRAEEPGTSPLSVSVVIPCLNEAENIEQCVTKARAGARASTASRAR